MRFSGNKDVILVTAKSVITGSTFRSPLFPKVEEFGYLVSNETEHRNKALEKETEELRAEVDGLRARILDCEATVVLLKRAEHEMRSPRLRLLRLLRNSMAQRLLPIISKRATVELTTAKDDYAMLAFLVELCDHKIIKLDNGVFRKTKTGTALFKKLGMR